MDLLPRYLRENLISPCSNAHCVVVDTYNFVNGDDRAVRLFHQPRLRWRGFKRVRPLTTAAASSFSLIRRAHRQECERVMIFATGINGCQRRAGHPAEPITGLATIVIAAPGIASMFCSASSPF